MKTCPFCKGNIKICKINHMHKWKDEFYLFENIRAEVCKQCGEVFFFPDTLKLIDKCIVEKKKGKKTISVPVIEIADMAVM
ncbi:MAG: YgiT-type zinc finger protein [Candidatus Brocadia sp.]|nr:MAG: YgiT-type zinc finger protein [Candidatus Brocadia sp.]